MRVAEYRVLSIKRHVLPRGRNCLHTSGQIEWKLAFRLSFINVENDIEERVRTGTVVTHECLGRLHDLRNSSGTVEVDVDDGRDGLVDSCLAGLLCCVVFERSGVLTEVSKLFVDDQMLVGLT